MPRWWMAATGSGGGGQQSSEAGGVPRFAPGASGWEVLGVLSATADEGLRSRASAARASKHPAALSASCRVEHCR